jgi:REP element-mobilizing transposase RayT
MRTTQLSIFDLSADAALKKRYGRTQHGGLRTKKGRKNERPLSKSKPLHLVLKSDKAVGRLSFLSLKNKPMVERIIRQKAKKFGILIQDFANVGNHLHLKLKISSRENFQKFLKAITTQIAKGVTQAKKGKPFGRFWQGLAFTRILTSRKEELYLKGYIEANRKEAVHSRTQRQKFLKEFHAWVTSLHKTNRLEDPIKKFSSA